MVSSRQEESIAVVFSDFDVAITLNQKIFFFDQMVEQFFIYFTTPSNSSITVETAI